MSVLTAETVRTIGERGKSLVAPLSLPRPLILTFHRVVRSASSSPHEVTLEQLENYLEVIQELSEQASGGSPAGQVTFDDGHISNYDLALPLLARYGLRATFFVVAGWTGVSPQHMNWSHLRTLVAMGHEVGSHSWSHPPMLNCSPAELRLELRRSKETLEDQLGLLVPKFATPYGRYSARVLGECAAAGYETLHVGEPWLRLEDCYGIRVRGRFAVPSTLSGFELRRILTARSLPFLCLQAKSQMKHRIKFLMGENAYRNVWLRMIRGITVLAAIHQVLSNDAFWQYLDYLIGS